MEVKVKAIINFKDLEEDKQRKAGKSEWVCSKERADFLVEHNAVEIIEELKKDVFEEFEKEVTGEIKYNIEEDTPLKVEFRPLKKSTKKSKK